MLANQPEKIKYIIETAKKRKIKLKFVTKENLDKLTLNKSHEGICIKAKERSYLDIKKFNEFESNLKKSEGNLVIFTQDISDTFTIGNIIQTGIYMGADYFITSKDDKHLINGNLAKASSGASETLELISVKFVKKFLQGKFIFLF